MDAVEVIALLPVEERADGKKVAPALVRLADGRVAIEYLGRTVAQARTRFRESTPIVDPATREVIGYEMEQVMLHRA